MPTGRFNLAIETSSRCGSISLGCEDDLLATLELVQPRRHNIDLMPAVDKLCCRYGGSPRTLTQVFVSVGPGSFTGLRIAIVTAKMLSIVSGARLVAVPTIDVLAQNGPDDAKHLAVCLNLKHDSVYACLFDRDGDKWRAITSPELTTLDKLFNVAPRPLTIVADTLGPSIDLDGHDALHLVPPQAARPRSDAVWHLGRAAAERDEYTDPYKLVPLYIRPPEAVALWDKRTNEAI